MGVNGKARKNRNGRTGNQSKEFQMDEVHLHMTCHCSVNPKMTLDRATGIISIPVHSDCPHCSSGHPTELVIGNVACDTDGRCPHPECDCDHVALQIPVPQFLDFLKPREE
jgi:hypothetical protein